MIARSLVRAAMLLAAVGASAQPLSTENAEGFGVYLRPLDDSDVEMQELTRKFFAMTPCGVSPVGLCEDALDLLRGGGDRLATYLIRQVVRNEAEGYPNKATYLSLVGYTEAPVAYRYLRDLADTREKAWRASESPGDAFETQQSLIFVVEALGNTRRFEVAEWAVRLLESTDDPEIQIRAINAFDRVQAKHGRQPAFESRLRTVRERNAADAASPGARGPGANGRIDKVLSSPGQTYP